MKEQDKERAIVVGMVLGKQDRELVEEYLDELALLADTAGAEVVVRVVQERNVIDPATFIGKGKAEELAALVSDYSCDVIIFDDDLSPAQMKNLEAICDIKVLDRSGIILDIFSRRAKTREAKTQVELAQLQYLLPRLTRRWTHLSRQTSGAGIGLRGPGETQLEVDRRLIRKRITHLSRDLEKIGKQRSNRRRRRKDLFNVALFGYTNVGKSTLMNALTTADVFVEDRLFATLDPTVRILNHGGTHKILLIDTVGFVRKLPHDLVASFKSTLEETIDADLLVHVIDASHKHFRDQMEVINGVIRDLHIEDRPMIPVFNKIDLVEDKNLLGELKAEFEKGHFVSARRGMFIEDLKKEIIRIAREQSLTVKFRVDPSKQHQISSIYSWTKVLSWEINDGFIEIEIQFPANLKNRYDQLIEHGIIVEMNATPVNQPETTAGELSDALNS
ncbi:MAG: GTPase HflX [Candidatus Zhuqueibacterota bacterium]